MKNIARLTMAACALLLSGGLAAQTFKCADAAGKITYSGKKCSELGLKDAGEVKDRLNINPAYQAPAQNERAPSPSAPAPAPEAQTTATPAEEAPAERRCFTVKTAKGNVTRCNDTPDD
jgi:hypothetical protein